MQKKQLKTYLDVLGQYHLCPETKFLNGDFLDKGTTQRRHIHATSIHSIGKEGNKWEEQFFTGFDPDAQIEYGISDEDKAVIRHAILEAIKRYGTKRIAQMANLSGRHILNISKDEVNLSHNTLRNMHKAIKQIEKKHSETEQLRSRIKKQMKQKNVSVRQLASHIKIDHSNLQKILSGKRHNSATLEAIHTYLLQNH